MSISEAAQLQVLLEGVPLPAGKQKLIAYAQSQPRHQSVAGLLERLPDREYGSLDEVGEELVKVQPERQDPDPHQPREESDLPPGGDAYTSSSNDTGRVREHGPHGD